MSGPYADTRSGNFKMNGSVKMISDIITQLNDAKLDGTTGMSSTAAPVQFTVPRIRHETCWLQVVTGTLAAQTELHIDMLGSTSDFLPLTRATLL